MLILLDLLSYLAQELDIQRSDLFITSKINPEYYSSDMTAVRIVLPFDATCAF